VRPAPITVARSRRDPQLGQRNVDSATPHHRQVGEAAASVGPAWRAPDPFVPGRDVLGRPSGPAQCRQRAVSRQLAQANPGT